MSFWIQNFQETLKVEYENGLKDKLKPFSDFLGSKKFFVSDEITFVDFHMYEVLEVLKKFSPKSFEEFPNLLAFLTRFEEIPQIKAYMESDRYRPVFLNRQCYFRQMQRKTKALRAAAQGPW